MIAGTSSSTACRKREGVEQATNETLLYSRSSTHYKFLSRERQKGEREKYLELKRHLRCGGASYFLTATYNTSVRMFFRVSHFCSWIPVRSNCFLTGLACPLLRSVEYCSHFRVCYRVILRESCVFRTRFFGVVDFGTTGPDEIDFPSGTHWCSKHLIVSLPKKHCTFFVSHALMHPHHTNTRTPITWSSCLD